jgi:hypothetical protein
MIWFGQKDILFLNWMSYLKMNFNDAYRSRIYPEDLIILDELSENINKTGENFKISYQYFQMEE